MPACQIETFSAFQVSTGPTVMALVGIIAILPPPEVLAFCAIVMGCRSTTLVVNFLYSSTGGGLSEYFPSRFGGSLNAQCLISPWPPCITTQRTPSQLFRKASVSAFGK